MMCCRYATPGTVPTSLRKNHMWRDIYWILPVDDEPVNPDIALLSLNFSPDLRLLVDRSFDAAVDTPEFWNPPKAPDANGEAGDEDDGALTLHKCLLKFSTREQLGAMDEWCVCRPLYRWCFFVSAHRCTYLSAGAAVVVAGIAQVARPTCRHSRRWTCGNSPKSWCST